MTTAVQPPRMVEVVTPDAVAVPITAVRDELAHLETHLAALRTEADALEAAVRVPFDAETHEFVAVRLRRFLDELRAESNGEIDSLLATADARARRHRPVVSFAHLVASDEQFGPEERPTSAPERPLADPVTAPAPAPITRPATETVPPLDLAPVTDAAPVDAFAELAALSAPAPASDLETAFWSDGDDQAPRRHFLRTARAVGLQAAAVVLVLAAVLIRIG